MSQYRAPLAEMQFVMSELAGSRRDRCAAGLRGRHARHRRRDPRGGGQVRDRRARSAESPSGDREGARWRDDGSVTTPAGFKDAYRQFCELGWNGLAKDPEYGGQGMPHLVAAAVDEMWNASNMAFELCPMLTGGAIEAIERNGSDALKQHLPAEDGRAANGPAR